MQRVLYDTDKHLELPDGWAILKQGAAIKKGDKYFNLDTKDWDDCSSADCTTIVNGESDVVIRRYYSTSDDYNPDRNLQVMISADAF